MLRVLIVDDEQFVRVSLRALYDWERNGFEIVGTADNGLEALEKIEALRPDILITDIVMPVMDGITLLEQIRRREIGITTLVISNLTDVENVKQALALGAEDYFLKVQFEREAFDRVMGRIRRAALANAPEAAPMPERPAENAAMALARAMAGGDAVGILTRHVFVVRIKAYHSELLCSFAKVYQPLSNLILETFKAYASVSFAPAPLPDALLIAVEEPIPAQAAVQLLKKLDAQLMIYLSASADILHFPATEGRPPVDRLRELAAGPAGRDRLRSRDDGRERGEAEQTPVDRAKRYIDEHIDQRLTLPGIARHAGLNPSYLSRAFAKKTGVPLIAYINDRKMRKAALLLKSGGHKVKDVAALLGYDDQYYFTRLFTKSHGVSPTEYRDSREE